MFRLHNVSQFLYKLAIRMENKYLNRMNIPILIVDDEPAIREMVSMALSTTEFSLIEASDSEMARSIIANSPPSLILLDWMLPGTSGLDFARQLKRNNLTEDIPIIMLTARTEENDKIRGFDSGSDDYITKPFSTRELIARIKVVLRRSINTCHQVLNIEGLELNPNTHRITVFNENVNVGPTEFKLLNFFMLHPERVYTRDQLIHQVWGGNVYIDERTVDVHIRRLRVALTKHSFDKMVQTVRSVGYRLSTSS